MNTKRKRVAIFGVGPSGLAVAHAAYKAGWDAVLLSKTDKPSELHGCQYLHKMLPGIDVESRVVLSSLEGSAQGYREKVYGGSWAGKVSPEDYIGSHLAWDLRATYKKLWEAYVGLEYSLLPFEVNPEQIAKSADLLRADYELIVSTVPAKSLCRTPSEHTFHSREIYAVGDRFNKDSLRVGRPNEDNYVICNGDPERSWYRTSKVFGVSTTEWPGTKKPPIEGVVKVEKPLWTDCDCFPWIERLGRYGAWRKSVLVHDVYRQANWLMANVDDGKAFMMSAKDRTDLCFRCGRVACSERQTVDLDATEYTCLNKHRWEVSEIDGKRQSRDIW